MNPSLYFIITNLEFHRYSKSVFHYSDNCIYSFNNAAKEIKINCIGQHGFRQSNHLSDSPAFDNLSGIH